MADIQNKFNIKIKKINTFSKSLGKSFPSQRSDKFSINCACVIFL